MSSAGIAISPMAVAEAAGAAVLLTETAAALIGTRGAAAAAEEEAVAALDSLSRADAHTAGGGSGERLRQSAGRTAWEQVAADVALVNARIAMLSERVARAQVAAPIVAVPTTLRLAGCTRAAAAAWADETTRALRAAQQGFELAVAADEARTITRRLRGTATSTPARDTAVVAACQSLLTSRRATSGVGADRRSAVLTDRTARVLRLLDVEANEQERRDVLTAAVLVARHEAHSADSYLLGLRETVATVNRLVARRRVAALWLAALQNAPAAGIQPHGRLQGTAARLRAVLAADEDLTPGLLVESARTAEHIEEAARRRFLLEAVRERLVAYGCAVQTEYDMEHCASLRITRSAWSGEHFADVWLDRNGSVRSELLRRRSLIDVEAAGRERARCLDHNAMMRALGSELGGAVEIDYSHRPLLFAEPGIGHADALTDD